MARRTSTQVDACALLVLVLIAGGLGLVALLHSVTAARPVLLLALAGGGALLVRRRRAAELATREQARIRAVRSTEVGRYHAMDATEFEDAIAYLCRRDGCTQAHRSGGAGDLGADVIATAPDGRRIVIQCKRYGTKRVGSQDLQRFGGTCYTVHRAQIAAVVTTSGFTKPAADYARSMGIHLYDQHALAAWATRTGPAPWML
ncbi:restriction endonuclease [Streptomyces sp. NPDC057257]|uniref:restriction endonuclease n=1 Tax=Streptomyces sp. NPDC057257 TaxID=3346071 RepID=UPI00362BB016